MEPRFLGKESKLDACNMGPGMYQYTAIDDCSRYRVMKLHKRRTATNTLLFLEDLLEEMPFPIQRIQTNGDGGSLQKSSGKTQPSVQTVMHASSPRNNRCAGLPGNEEQ